MKKRKVCFDVQTNHCWTCVILSDVGNVSAVDMLPSTLKILAIGTKPPNLRGGKKKKLRS